MFRFSRAYLMSVDFEPAVESDQDIITQDRRLLFPYGTPFYHLYEHSPLIAQRQVAARVKDFKHKLTLN